MKGLLKAYLNNPSFDINTDRRMKPDRLGVTLLYSDTYSGEVENLVRLLNGNVVRIKGKGLGFGIKTDFIQVSVCLKESVKKQLETLYKYPHHITLGWDEDSAPLVAAIELKTGNFKRIKKLDFEITATIEWIDFL